MFLMTEAIGYGWVCYTTVKVHMVTHIDNDNLMTYRYDTVQGFWLDSVALTKWERLNLNAYWFSTISGIVLEPCGGHVQKCTQKKVEKLTRKPK